jgi:hypothetical protein
MARRYDIRTNPDGTQTMKKRPGWIWWSLYIILIIGALADKHWAVKLIGVAGILIAVFGLAARNKQRRTPAGPPNYGAMPASAAGPTPRGIHGDKFINDKLAELHRLRHNGAITDSQFDEWRSNLLR